MEGLNDQSNDDAAPLYRSDEFRMYCFKVLPCSKRFCHDWTTCPFAHPAEKAKRRDPRTAIYTGVACPEMKRLTVCPRGEACNFAHNVFEYWLHPSRYRTQLCNDGLGCRRKICFFAHTMEELRVSSVKVQTPDLDRYGPDLLHYSFDSGNSAVASCGGHRPAAASLPPPRTSTAMHAQYAALDQHNDDAGQQAVQQQYERALQQHQHMLMVAASEQQQAAGRESQHVQHHLHQEQQQHFMMVMAAAEGAARTNGDGARSLTSASLPTPCRAVSFDHVLLQQQRQQQQELHQQQQLLRRHVSLDASRRVLPHGGNQIPGRRPERRPAVQMPHSQAQREELVKLQLEAQLRQERQLLIELQQEAAQQHRNVQPPQLPPPALQLFDNLAGSLAQLQASGALNDPSVATDLVRTMMQLLASAHQAAHMPPPPPQQQDAVSQQQERQLLAALQILQQQQAFGGGGHVAPPVLHDQKLYCQPPPPRLSLEPPRRQPSGLERMASVMAPVTPSRDAMAPLLHHLSDSQVGSGQLSSPVSTMASPSEIARHGAAAVSPSALGGAQKQMSSDGVVAPNSPPSAYKAAPWAYIHSQEDRSGSPSAVTLFTSSLSPSQKRSSPSPALASGLVNEEAAAPQHSSGDLFSSDSDGDSAAVAATAVMPAPRPVSRVVPLSELQQTFKLLHDHQVHDAATADAPAEHDDLHNPLKGSKLAFWSLSDSIVPTPRQASQPLSRGSLDLQRHASPSLNGSSVTADSSDGLGSGGNGLDFAAAYASTGGGAHSLFSSSFSGIHSSSSANSSGEFSSGLAEGGLFGQDGQVDAAALKHMFLSSGLVF